MGLAMFKMFAKRSNDAMVVAVVSISTYPESEGSGNGIGAAPNP